METDKTLTPIKKRIITHYIYNGTTTIPELAKELDLSVPTITKIVSEMCEDGYINTANSIPKAGVVRFCMALTLIPVTSLASMLSLQR
jgi:predicted transcriptional regulator